MVALSGGTVFNDCKQRTETVPEDHVYVMGDDRGKSPDCRDFGPIQTKNLLFEVLRTSNGRVFVKVEKKKTNRKDSKEAEDKN
ncbi:hypothetical protein L596_014768 [Steinernema carpocapsae]|uniref:Peptidase S26 domain-containing protein n=1 Tax=Steinernema carpocapsae TaxID=34508 RepID=A0A4U5ND40_STECR|nr:hypothetical protein L596_014768 [Steinernema carpocapsae]